MPQDNTGRLIVRTADAIKSICAPTNLPPNRPASPIHNVSFQLPSPPSIHTNLVRLGLDAHLVEDFARKYDQMCGEIHSRAQLSLATACRDLAAVPEHSALTPLPQLLSGVITAYTTRYTRSIQTLEQRALDMASKLVQARGNGEKVEKKVRNRAGLPAFNHAFTPVLEKYFEYNAYPSAAERAEIAKKSTMKPRQIEIWFQNHRRRAKEEGMPVTRLAQTDPTLLERCLQSMGETTEPFSIPDSPRQSVDSEVSEAESDEEEEEDDDDESYAEQPEIVDPTNVLNPGASRRAYPVSRKALRFSELETQTFLFPASNWPRTAANTPPRHADITMDELAASFDSLNVKDTWQVLSPPFQIATTVIPPAAPLPALVHGKFTFSPVLATTFLNTVPASSSSKHPFRSPSPSAQPATLVPSASPRRKKVAGPPRRTPTKKRASNPQHRGASPAMSDTSTLRSVSPPSRAPSFASSPPSRTPSLEFSDFSPSRTPSFGSSSGGSFSSRSSSCSSSGPTTPSGSPSVRPLEIADLDPFGDFARVQQYAHAYAASPVEEPEYAWHGKQQQRQLGFARYASP